MDEASKYGLLKEKAVTTAQQGYQVYEVNYDGRARRGVYTRTKARALALMGVTAGRFAGFGTVRDGSDPADALLRASPDVPMQRRTTVRDGWETLPVQTRQAGPDDGPGL